MIEHDRRAALRGDFSSFLEWPRGIARLGVVLCTAVALGFGLVYFVKAVDRLGDDARGRTPPRTSTIASSRVEMRSWWPIVPLYEARALIPEDETYRVIAGPGVDGATELTRALHRPLRAATSSCHAARRPTRGGSSATAATARSSETGFEILLEDEAGILVGRLPG